MVDRELRLRKKAPSKAGNMSHQHSAARALSIYELIEAILVNLPFRNIITVQAVCRTWHDVVASSPWLQSKITHPMDETDPYLQPSTVHPVTFDMLPAVIRRTIPTFGWMNHEASWRQLPVLHPPRPHVLLEVMGMRGPGFLVRQFTVECRNEAGVTVGSVADVLNRALEDFDRPFDRTARIIIRTDERQMGVKVYLVTRKVTRQRNFAAR